METDRLDQQALDGRMPSWISEVRFLTETGSTNEDAVAWAVAGAPEGCLVVSDYQRAGKGRLGRSWFAPPGQSLLFTLILRPQLDSSRLGLINLAAAVGLCQVLSDRGVPASIKWPNDVLTDGRKLAGVLSERKGDAVCLGVGINVNVERFPDELGSIGTSLLLATGRRFDRADLLAGFLRRFGALYADRLSAVPEAFRRWCTTLGMPVRVNLAERTVEGTALDIDDSGELILDTGEVINAGDVVHLGERGQGS
jgi:BirA family transcriptional regulator, biotin operon repressor / biotin---[acetyl-CoA-carboxylase] ligase